MAAVGSARAQEYHMRPDSETADEEFDRIDEQKILYSPGEATTKYIPSSTPTVKDSASAAPANPAIKIKIEKTTPAPKQSADKQSKQEDESILSFNFLYYIIQKYKLQDIVD
jgi:hypothetical protein